MKKNNHKNYWKNFPEELKLMCLAEVRGTGHYCTSPVLKCLADHMNECDSYNFGITPYDVIRWIDTAVEMCLFPLEWHENDWIENIEDIRKALARSEELLLKVAPADYKEGHRTSYDSQHEFSVIEYIQKLDVYFCVLYMFTGEWQKLQDRLDQQLIPETERNVRYMLCSEHAAEYASRDEWAEFHYPGTDAWEPINWLCRESIPHGNARKLFAKSYEKYVMFLNNLDKGEWRSKALSHLISNAEKRLRDTCEMILDEVEDCLEDADGDEQSLMADKELYESIIQKSVERAAEDKKVTGCACGETGDRISELYYHRKWWDFTQKLRKLMEEYSTLPVVVPYQLGMNGGTLDCSVADVHDHKTGKFRERIITIHDAKDSFTKSIGDDYFDLPF